MTDPSTIRTALARAWALLEVGRRADAARTLTAAIAHQPDHPEALALLAYCLLADQPVEALAAADRAVAAGPNHPAAHGARADALGALRRQEEAVRAATVAIELAPGSAAAHRRLADHLLSWYATMAGSPFIDDGRRLVVDRARQHVDRALALAPTDPDGYVLDGDIHQLAGRRRRSRAAYRRALALQPDHQGALRGLAATSSTDRAVQRLTDAAGLRPGDPVSVGAFWEALRTWLMLPLLLGPGWFGLAALLALAAEVPQPVNLLLAAGLIGYLGWYGAHRRRSFAAFPPAARALLPRLVRRPDVATALLLTAIGAVGVVVALVVPAGGREPRAWLATVGWVFLVAGPLLSLVPFPRLRRLLRRPEYAAAALAMGAGVAVCVVPLLVWPSSRGGAAVSAMYVGLALLLGGMVVGLIGQHLRERQRPGWQETQAAQSRPGLVAAVTLAPEDPAALASFWQALRYWVWQRISWAFVLAVVISVLAMAGTPRPVGLPIAVAALVTYGWWLRRWSVPALPDPARRALPGLLRRWRFVAAMVVVGAAAASAVLALAFPAGTDPRFGFGSLSLLLQCTLILAWAMAMLVRLAGVAVRRAARAGRAVPVARDR